MTTAVQLNIELPNVPGSLAKLSDLLRSADVNIDALCASEGEGHSLLHLIVDDTETAKILLKPVCKFTTTTLLAFKMKNSPGAVAQIALVCAGSGINIGQIYSTTNGKEAMVYVSVDDLDRALEIFSTKSSATMPAMAMAR